MSIITTTIIIITIIIITIIIIPVKAPCVDCVGKKMKVCNTTSGYEKLDRKE